MNIRTKLKSAFMSALSSQGFNQFLQHKARVLRRLRSGNPQVHYFHQVDDPYSHLAVQKLDLLKDSYEVDFNVHLVNGPTAEFKGDQERFDHWAQADAQAIASYYGTHLDCFGARPTANQVAIANGQLTEHLHSAEFAALAIDLGDKLWQGVPLLGDLGKAEEVLRAGDKLRSGLGHYLGAMFYFDGEWFWGIDRIRCLEQRLISEGFARNRDPQALVPEPGFGDRVSTNGSDITLEYFPSLRSPYTAVGHMGVLSLLERTGVTLRLRPVLPMMMRGIPAPRAKQLYIIRDAAREARFRGIDFGHIVDPFGEPVRRAFALFPAAQALGKGLQFVTAYLDAAWTRGLDITTQTGLRRVVESAGLDWQALNDMSRGTDWQALLDENLQAMLESGLWGVPSFRVTGGGISESFSCWGQDRLWRVEAEILSRTATP